MQDDEDLTHNSTLAVKLDEFGIELPDIDSGIESVSKYLKSVSQRISSRPDWRVLDEIYLATFAYSKLAMWRDLETIKNKGTDHSIVLTLAGADPPCEPNDTPNLNQPSSHQDLAGGGLDDLLDVRDQFAVLPADYSQLVAIDAARSGQNLVIHGPPGTGKSQTIANIISTLVWEGKTVLFVSEKTAALDVVKRRLDEKQLGNFCLDLHSERGRKASVYEQLQRSVEGNRTIQQLDYNYSSLAERRQQLNQLVRLLHKGRERLERSAFQIQGRFSVLRNVPHVGFVVRDIANLDQGRLTNILQAADRVALRQKEYQDHWTSHWRILKGGIPTLELANTIRNDMQLIDSAVQRVRSVTDTLAEALGVPQPEGLPDVISLKDALLHFTKAPGIPPAWLQVGVTERLGSLTEREANVQRIRGNLLEHLQDVFGTPVPRLNYAALAERLAISPSELEVVETLLGGHWGDQIVRSDRATSTEIKELKNALNQLLLVNMSVAKFLGLPNAENLPEISSQLELVEKIAQIGPVPAVWTESRRIQLVTTLGSVDISS